MKLEKFTDKRGVLLWASPKIVGFDYKYITISTIRKGRVRGGHYHKRIYEKILCIKGILELELNGIKTILEVGDLEEIPTGIKHSVKNIGNVEAFFVEFKSEEFNENDKDIYTA